jgi:hypothetical protein
MFNLFNLGLTALVPLVVLAVVFVAYKSWRAGPSLGPALVLRDFYVNDRATDPRAVEIRGRVQGIIAWLLTVIGVDTETTMTVTADRFSLQSASFSGREVSQVPLARVASTYSAYYQPTWAAMLSVLSGACGLLGALSHHDTDGGSAMYPLLTGLLFAALFGYIFKSGQKIRIWIETLGGATIGVCFKPSFIEGVSVSLDNALRVAALINNQVMRAANPNTVPIKAPAATSQTLGGTTTPRPAETQL